MIAALLTLKGDVHAVDGQRCNTAVHWAAMHQGADTIKLLAAAKARVDLQNREELTSMNLAVQKDDRWCIHALSAAGADMAVLLDE